MILINKSFLGAFCNGINAVGFSSTQKNSPDTPRHALILQVYFTDVTSKLPQTYRTGETMKTVLVSTFLKFQILANFYPNFHVVMVSTLAYFAI